MGVYSRQKLDVLLGSLATVRAHGGLLARDSLAKEVIDPLRVRAGFFRGRLLGNWRRSQCSEGRARSSFPRKNLRHRWNIARAFPRYSRVPSAFGLVRAARSTGADRVHVQELSAGLLIVLCDGAGNDARGAEAASRVCEFLASSFGPAFTAQAIAAAISTVDRSRWSRPTS